MEKRMSAWETRRNFGKVLRDVSMNRQSVVVESHGEEVAVVVPLSDYRALQNQRERLKDELDQISGTINLTEEEAMRLALDVQAEVRAERKSLAT